MKKKELLIILILAVLATALFGYFIGFPFSVCIQMAYGYCEPFKVHWGNAIKDFFFLFGVLALIWWVLKFVVSICKTIEKKVLLTFLIAAILVTLFSGFGLYKLDVDWLFGIWGNWAYGFGIPLSYLIWFYGTIHEPKQLVGPYLFPFILDCLFWFAVFTGGWGILRLVLEGVRKGVRKSRRI